MNNTADKETRLAYGVAKFIREVQTAETNIGHKTADGLTQIGLILGRGGTPVTLLSEKEIEIKHTPMFNWGTSEIVHRYLEEYDKDSKKLVIDKMNKLNSFELVFMPIKPKHKFVTSERARAKSKLQYTIDFVRWHINKETNLMECIIGSDIDIITDKITKVSLSDYNKKYWLSHIIGNIKERTECNLIQFNRYGCIDTVRVADNKNQELIIDNAYMILKQGDTFDIVGRWVRNKLQLDPEYKYIEDLNLYKEIAPHLPYISQHKTYIAPYILGLCG